MTDLTKHARDRAKNDNPGARHGDVTGAWRVVLNGSVIAVVALGALWIGFAVFG